MKTENSKFGLFGLLKICKAVFGTRFLSTIIHGNPWIYAALDDDEEDDIVVMLCIRSRTPDVIDINFINCYKKEIVFYDKFKEKALSIGYEVQVIKQSSIDLSLKVTKINTK